MTNPVAPVVDPGMLVVQASVYHALLTEIEKRKSDAKSALSQLMSAGDRIAGKDPRTGETLGAVSKSDPETTARVTDRATFEAWVRDRYADILPHRPVFGAAAEVAAVLAQHAPHLLRDEVVIPDAVTKAALHVATKEVVPGTARYTPDPVLSIRTKAAVGTVVAELLASAPMLALEAGQ